MSFLSIFIFSILFYICEHLLTYFYVNFNPGLFVDIFVFKSNYSKLYNALKERINSK